MTKSIWTIEVEGGESVAVLPVDKYKDAIRTIRKEAESTPDKDAAADLRNKADITEAELNDLLIVATEHRYEIKSFTRAQRLEAKREATTWQGDSARFDEDLYHSLLMAQSTGKTLGEIQALNDNHGTALLNLVFANAYPTIPKLISAGFILHGSDAAKN